MQIRLLGSLGFIALIFVEIAAYAIVISGLGWGAAFLIGIGSTVAGVLVLKRLGQGLLKTMSESAISATTFRLESFYAGGFATAGAMLMLLPGFATDLAGLVCAAIGWRAWLWPARRSRTPRPPAPGERPSPDKTMDLRRDEWTSR